MKTHQNRKHPLAILLAGAALTLATGITQAQAAASHTSAVEEECLSDFGECFVRAAEPDEAGHFTSFGTQCSCNSGEEWSSEMLSSKGQHVNQHTAEFVCMEALANCEPPSTPAPSGVEIFPTSDIDTTLVECSREGETQDKDISCFVLRDERGVSDGCECNGETYEILFPRTNRLSEVHAHRRCAQQMDICEVKAKNQASEDDQTEDDENTEDEGETEGCEDTEDTEDIEDTEDAESADEPKHPKDPSDVLDSIGCELSTNAPASPWSMALGILLLGGALRRRRSSQR